MSQDANGPKIGLVLGSGGARGYAHLGVLKVLHEQGIHIDLIAGTSFGSIIGAAYAAGCDIYELEKIALEISWIKLFKMADIALPEGIFAGNKLESFFSSLTQQKHFSELRVPLAVVTTDIKTGEEVLINKRPVSRAILASSALPGIFAPVKMDGRWLVDGSLVNPLPIQTAFDMGADMVIAVDVSSPIDNINQLLALKKYLKIFLQNIYYQIPIFSINRISVKFQCIIPAGFTIIERAFNVLENNQSKMVFIPDNDSVVVIKPRVENIRWCDFHQAQRCIELGVEAVNHALQDIKKNYYLIKTPDFTGLKTGGDAMTS